MAITEDGRFRVQRKLREVMGDEEAVLLMELLPPVGWSGVATRRDLDHLEQKMDTRFEAVDARFDRLDARFASVEARFESIDARFESIEARFESIDHRLEATEARLMSHVDRGLRRNLTVMVTVLLATTGAANAATVMALGALGT